MTIFIASTVLIPFTMIIVGATNMQNCPAEHIPLFLLVGGTVWITRNILNFLNKCSSVRIGRDTLTYAGDTACPTTTATNISNNNSSNSNNNSNQNNNLDTIASCSHSGTTPTSSGLRSELRSTGNSANTTNPFTFLQPCTSTTSCSSSSNAANGESTTASTSASAGRGRYVINLNGEEELNRVINESYPPIKNRRREFLINSFIFIWFITGCVMVYRIFPPDYLDETKPNYCNKAVYLYAFWLITSVFILFFLFVSCICCISIAAIFSTHTERGRRSAFSLQWTRLTN